MISSPQGLFGSVGEEVFRVWLKQQGYYVVPVSLIDNGGAPMLEGWVKKHVLPDVLAVKDGTTAWVDVKAKARFTTTVRQTQETGMPLRHYREYLEVERLTKIRGALAFIHLEQKMLNVGFLDDIRRGSHEYHGPKFPESMIFFDLRQFATHHLEENGLFRKLKDASIAPVVRRTWEPKPELNLDVSVFLDQCRYRHTEYWRSKGGYYPHTGIEA